MQMNQWVIKIKGDLKADSDLKYFSHLEFERPYANEAIANWEKNWKSVKAKGHG